VEGFMDHAEIKAKIVEVIKENIVKNIDGVKKEDIDISKPMSDYGANSLDIIEVVSCSMRELNLKVPRSELTDIKNIEGLAEKFAQFYQ
jgi:polyketide biosynthesis acyl carrier protein